jgi:hypothetical protein
MTEKEQKEREESLREQGFDESTIASIIQAENSTPEPKKKNIGKYILYIGAAVVAVLFVIVLNALFSATGTKESLSEHEIDVRNRLIFYTAQTCVERRLKYPASSEFPSYNSASVNEMIGQEKHFIVNSYVDAANGFGALERRNYKVQLKEIGEDNYLEVTTEIY